MHIFSYFIFLFLSRARLRINYDFVGLMAIMTNKPIMAIMTVVNITTNITNCVNYTSSRVLGLTKPILKASKGAKMTTLREDFQLPEVDLIWPIHRFGTLFLCLKVMDF